MARSKLTIRDLTVKDRILLHLFDYVRYADDYEVPAEVTQDGLAAGAGIRVQHVTQYVRPLIGEGLIEEGTRHIRGGKRRRRVYFLTPPGSHAAASLRKTIFDELVPFRIQGGVIRALPLSRIYQDDRRGTRLLGLLNELQSFGFIGEAVEASPRGIVDFTQEAPRVDQFYGRERELEEIVRGLERAQIVVVTGLAGIGKTTLGAKVCGKLRSSQSLLWNRVRPWDRAVDVALRLAGFLKALGKPGLDSSLRESGVTALSKVEELLLADLAGLRALLVFDDVHDAQGDTQNFLSLLYGVLKQQQGCSALFLSRRTPSFYSRRDVEVDAEVVELSLSGLDASSAINLLSDAGVKESQFEDLLKMTGASPLFLQIAAKAVTPEEIRRTSTTLEAYIAEEIEPDLSREEQRCMQVGAVYQVPVRAEGFLVEGEGGTATLVALHKKGLLVRSETGLWLAHDVLRGYFQGGLASKRREDIVDRAAPWLLKEAAASRDNGQILEAIALVENAVAIETRDGRAGAALRQLGDLRSLLGDHEGAESAFRAALKRLMEPSAKARLHERIASSLINRLHLDGALSEVETGLALLPTTPSTEAAWLVFRRAVIVKKQDEFDKLARDLDQIAGWIPILPGDPVLAGSVALLRGDLYRWDPSRLDLSLAKAEYARGADAFKASGDLAGLGWAQANLARVAFEMGQVDEALSHVDQAIALAERAGWLPALASGFRIKATYLVLCLGEYDTAEALLQKSYSLAKQTHDRLLLADHHRIFTELCRFQGRNEEARESLRYRFELQTGVEFSVSERIDELGLMVRLCVLCGDKEAAERSLKEARELHERQPSDATRHVLHWAEGQLRSSLGAVSEAGVSFRNAMEILPPSLGGRTSGEFLIEYARVLTRAGKTEEARLIFGQAISELKERGRKPLEEQARRELRALDFSGG